MNNFLNILIFLLIRLTATELLTLQTCPDIVITDKLSQYPVAKETCNLVKEQHFVESYIIFISTNYITSTCTLTPVINVYISSKFVIDIKNKTIYKRNEDISPVIIPCVPDNAEYLSNGIYYVIHHYSTPIKVLQLKGQFIANVCSNLFAEATKLSSKSTSSEEIIKFIRRITSNDYITGTLKEADIYYTSCNQTKLDIVKKLTVESDCFSGSKIMASDGGTYYTTNGLDIINTTKVDTCLKSTPYKIYQSRLNNTNNKNDKVSSWNESPNSSSLGFVEKFVILDRSFQNFNTTELAALFLFIYSPLILSWFWFIALLCCYCCLRKKQRSENTPNTTYSVIP